jgi:hypothetical protein
MGNKERPLDRARSASSWRVAPYLDDRKKKIEENARQDDACEQVDTDGRERSDAADTTMAPTV